MTVRSRGEPFVGKWQNATPPNQCARNLKWRRSIYFLGHQTDANGNPTETIVDASQSPPVRLFTLYRRVLLVAPGVSLTGAATDVTFYNAQ